MKEQLIKLSKEKGFESIVKIDSLKADKDNNIGVDDLNNYLEVGYYLWLCELQKWLREKHNMNIYIQPNYSQNSEYVYMPVVFYPGLALDDFETYEQALEIGLMESLKLIK